MNSLITKLDQLCYPKFGDNWDDKLFRDRILTNVNPTSSVLDVGAGAGIVCQMNFRGIVANVCGVDIDPRIVNNQYLDESRVLDAAGITYENNRFDVAFADNVLEHLENPLSVFREVARVLKPGGVFLFKTPNKNHYVPLIARLTPHGFHRYVNRLRGREEANTFPTFYRANSKSEISKLAQQSGFVTEKIERIEGRPEYLRFAWPAYLMGAAYERTVNATELFAPLRILLMGTLRKRA